MAEIRNFVFVRHLRADASSHVLRFRRSRLLESGRGLAFWFMPMSTSLAEVPVDDREISLLFHGRSADFQDVTVQGVLTYRVVAPASLAERVDFTIDLRTGAHLKQPLDKVALALSELAQQHAWGYLGATPIRELLADGGEKIRERVESRLSGDEHLAAMGLEIVSVRISSVKPTPEVEKALEAPARERIQQSADEAAFQRRALAVEKERAIQENELVNRIELAKREETLIGQQGQNGRRTATEEAEARRITAAAAAEEARVRGEGEADRLRLVEGARAETERAMMEVYKAMPPKVLFALAAQELAAKLQKIEHLNVTPELFGSALTELIEAGTRKLEAKEKA